MQTKEEIERHKQALKQTPQHNDRTKQYQSVSICAMFSISRGHPPLLHHSVQSNYPQTLQQRTGNSTVCSVHSWLSPARRRALLDVLEQSTDCTYLQPSVTKRTLPPRWASSSSLWVLAAQRWRCWRNTERGIPGAGLSSAGAHQTASSLFFSSQTKPWNLSILSNQKLDDKLQQYMYKAK